MNAGRGGHVYGKTVGQWEHLTTIVSVVTTAIRETWAIFLPKLGPLEHTKKTEFGNDFWKKAIKLLVRRVT